MLQIRPISDLRNNFKEIQKAVEDEDEPVILTKNGYGAMVVMSINRYEKMENEIESLLLEAELERCSTDLRYSHEEVFSNLRERLENGE